MENQVMAYDPQLAERLGLTREEVQALIDQGISIEEYAAMLGEDLSEEVSNAQASAVRYSIVHPAQVWQNEATDETKKSLVGIPVYFHPVRGYFVEGLERPVCSSLDGKTGYFINEDGEKVSRECTRCPFNAWGSGPNGRGKLCKELRRIYLLEEGHELPAVVSLPPTSLRVWDAFVAACAYEGLPVSGRVVELTLEKQSSGAQVWSTLAKPRTVRRLSPTEYIRVRTMKQQIEDAARQAKVSANEYFADSQQAVEATVTTEQTA
ncbi:hypothetical protein IW967_11620 [Alicyclobacillus mali]|uniref:Uncharacterized protein n=1 Tax=Alicyclobacillus mali (ex Roth et al. 2021) TaxID=1123961 RepID=A0ABS0F5G4_9BACL|nr:hypothetical protein [Alicyclobacillus mali (ex Roth et al. 2021)]MBF8378503.1 hypothetical protein [Alicyclobacillus mali (ex Roth et al. 2021)]